MKFEITKKKVPRQDVMNFTRQLAVFMRAGIPIMEALEVIVEETQNKMLKAILSEMVDSLRRVTPSPPRPRPTLRPFPRFTWESSNRQN